MDMTLLRKEIHRQGNFIKYTTCIRSLLPQEYIKYIFMFLAGNYVISSVTKNMKASWRIQLVKITSSDNV